MRVWALVLALGFGLALGGIGPARAQTPSLDALTDALDAQDRGDVERAVAAIEHAPTTPDLDEALGEAARACEDVLADPARALALYDRILREFPSGSASRVARVRAQLLRDRVGTGNAHAQQAAALAQLVLAADALAVAEVLRRADDLASEDWPGAPDAALFLAEWLQRTGRLAEAERRYAALARRWPDAPQALAARRGGASTAIQQHAWNRAEALARALPAADDADHVLREELLDRIARGRRLDFWYRIAWVQLALCLLLLVLSLALAIRRGGRPRWRPPVEVVFLLPVGAVLVGVALTTHRAIAPAVCALSLGGLVLAWLSGITLELLRVQRKPIGMRGLVHAALCFGAIVALAYITLTHNDLLDMVIETVQFGPDP